MNSRRRTPVPGAAKREFAAKETAKSASQAQVAAADKGNVAQATPPPATVVPPAVSNTAPAPLAPSVASAATSAPEKKPVLAGGKDVAAERLKGIGDDADQSAGSQIRRDKNSNMRGGNASGFQTDAFKTAKMQTVVLRVENVQNMVDKVQIVAALHGLYAQIDPAPAIKPAAPTQAPPPPAAVLMMTAPVDERTVVQDLFQLQTTNASVDEIMARNAQSTAKKKQAAPAEKTQAQQAAQNLDASQKLDERYLIRVEIYTK